MPKIVRKSTFETNSSSAHSIVIPKDALLIENLKHKQGFKDFNNSVVILNLKNNDDYYGENDDGIIFNSLKDKLTFLLKDLFYHFSENHSELYSLPNNISQCYQDFYFDNIKEISTLKDKLKELFAKRLLLNDDKEESKKINCDILEIEFDINKLEDSNKELFKIVSKDFKSVLLTKRTLTHTGHQMITYILDKVKEITGAQDVLIEFDQPIIHVPLFGEDYDTLINGINGVYFWYDYAFHHSFYLNGKKIQKSYSTENSFHFLEKDEIEKIKKNPQVFIDFENNVNAKYYSLDKNINNEEFKNPLYSFFDNSNYNSFTFWDVSSLPNEYGLPIEFLTNKDLVEKFLFNPKSYFRIGCNNGASALDPKLSKNKSYLSIYDDEIKSILKKYDIIYNGSFLDKII